MGCRWFQREHPTHIDRPSQSHCRKRTVPANRSRTSRYVFHRSGHRVRHSGAYHGWVFGAFTFISLNDSVLMSRGYFQIEVYHHSRDVPATTTKLVATLDRSNGKVIKANPRVVAKGASAELQLTLRSTAISGAQSLVRGIPMEPFSANKDMGRILIRRGGETIAAGEQVLLH